MVFNTNGDGDRWTGTRIGASFSSDGGGGFNVQLIAIARACVGRLSRSMISLHFDLLGDFRSLVLSDATSGLS